MKLNEIKSKSSLKPYMFQTKEEIENWMKNNRVEGFVSKELTIHPSTTKVSIDDFNAKDPYVTVKNEKRLPVQFELAPNFELSYEEINSLIGLPFTVLGNLTLRNTKLKNLEGCPKLVNGLFTLSLNSTHLKDFSKFCQHCEKLAVYNYNKSKSIIDTLEGISSNLKVLSIGCDFFDIKDIVKNCANLTDLFIASKLQEVVNYPFLNFFKLKQLENFQCYNDELFRIINKHLHNERDMLECQEELISNGFKNFARL